jgi:hypothetical protein
LKEYEAENEVGKYLEGMFMVGMQQNWWEAYRKPNMKSKLFVCTRLSEPLPSMSSLWPARSSASKFKFTLLAKNLYINSDLRH